MQDTAHSFDTSEFLNLEYLKVHEGNVGESPTQAALALFHGHKQDTLTLDYSPRKWVSIEPKDMDWLELFIEAVGAQCKTSLPRKRRIILVTNSHSTNGWADELKKLILKRLNVMIGLARKVGIEFSYLEPPIQDWDNDPSRREWEEHTCWKDIDSWQNAIE